MEAEEKAALLKAWALAEGFDRAGVASLEPSEHGAAFGEWLDRGRHAGMRYLERRTEVRLDPSRLLPGARSALCVALDYLPAAEVGGDLWPRVARYAHGEDYHLLMGRRLERLAQRIREAFPGCATRPYVDTGPILERELAARAGIGVFGKNTNLLHPEAGSWFLVGELLLTLELGSDSALADLCGSCTACLEACPTGALPAPYELDSTRCISYWTIEHRGALPPDARRALGDWVFGCDICQEVCPANESAAPTAHGALRLPAARRELDLAALLALGQEEYAERFRGNAMKRAKLAGLRRNAAVVMGNRGERSYLEPLTAALAAADEVVRGHAAWALGEIGGESAVAALELAAGREQDPATAAEIGAALKRARQAR